MERKSHHEKGTETPDYVKSTKKIFTNILTVITSTFEDFIYLIISDLS